VSTADLELFGPPDADGTFPRFTTVLRGYDPEQVRDFALRLAARVDTLERELEETRTQRDAARKRYGTARDDAYNQLGQRMADMLRMADQQAERIRRDAEEEAKQRVIQSRQLAASIEREAEEHSQTLRSRGEEALQQATRAREELLGGLSASRDLALADMAAARDHLDGILERLRIAMDLARAARIADQGDMASQAQEETSAEAQPEPAPHVEDILVRTEGFDIMLPEFLLREPEDREPEDRQPQDRGTEDRGHDPADSEEDGPEG
jgi:DivIVA domain-containing protein